MWQSICFSSQSNSPFWRFDVKRVITGVDRALWREKSKRAFFKGNKWENDNKWKIQKYNNIVLRPQRARCWIIIHRPWHWHRLKSAMVRIMINIWSWGRWVLGVDYKEEVAVSPPVLTLEWLWQLLKKFAICWKSAARCPSLSLHLLNFLYSLLFKDRSNKI